MSNLIKESPYYYYVVLEVPRDASMTDIKKAYKRLALKHHPDKNVQNPLSEEKFKELSQAFQVLSDMEKRRVYDFCGGVDSSSIVMSKRVEDFCSGIVVGVFSIIANVACATLIGIPLNIPVSYWTLAAHLFTTWQMVPESLEAAKNIENWSKALGTLISPVILVITTSAAAVYLLCAGSKAALSYSQHMLGDYFTNTLTKQSSDQATNAGYTPMCPNQNLSEEDFVLLEDHTKTLENEHMQSQAACQEQMIDSRFQRSDLSESENEWVLVDTDQECCLSNQSIHGKSKDSQSTFSDDWVEFSSSASITDDSKSYSSNMFNSQTNTKFNKYHQLPEGWIVVDKFYV